MAKLVELQVCTNNRQDSLFKWFIPSLDNLISLRDYLSITINFNGSMSEEDRARAVRLIEEKGFEVHYAYNQYFFKQGRHAILSIRNDCNKIDPNKGKYVLMADDDCEYYEGFDRQLLIAIDAMERNEKIGLVNFHDFQNKDEAKREEERDVVLPANTFYIPALYGGILLRAPQGENLYPRDCVGLYGGGEERIWAVIVMRQGQWMYYINTERYNHECHWDQHTGICGQGVYGWVWNKQEKFTISWKIQQYLRKDGQIYWTGEPYWQDPNNRYDYKEISFEDLLDRLKQKEEK